MIIARTAPWLRAPADAVKPTPWRLIEDSRDTLLGDVLPTWDPGMDLHLIRTLEFDPAALRQACALPENAALRVAATWHCDGTTLRGRGSSELLERSEPVKIPLTLDIAGTDLAGELRVRTSIVLGRAQASAPLRARRPGAVLWEDEHTIGLEGGGTRFPMELISFEKSGWHLPKGSAWALEWDHEDLELPVLGGLRLYLNSDHPVVKRSLESPGDPASRVFIAAMHYDIGRQLIVGALNSDAFVERGEKYPDDSIGRVVQRLMASRFRGDSALALRERLRQNPEQFEAVLQDRLRAFHEEG